MIRQNHIAAAVACSMLLASPALAGLLVDTGAPTESESVLSVGIYGDYEERLAAKFSLVNQSRITDVEAYLNTYNFGTFGFQIVSDAGGSPNSGTVLFEAAPYIEGNPTGEWTGPTGLNWDLAAGDYWLILRAIPGSSLFAQVGLETPNPLSTYAVWDSDGQTWTTFIPSPQNPYDFGVRIFGTAGAVPEPASWTLMIAGFALTGAALRRRRLQSA